MPLAAPVPPRSQRHVRWVLVLGLLAAAAVAPRWTPPPVCGDDKEAVERRLAADVAYLASDRLEGRGLGTEGLDQAAQHIAAQFAAAGLEAGGVDGGPYQPLNVPIASEMGPLERNRLTLVGPGGREGTRRRLRLDRDFRPLAIGGSGQVDAPLVFAGYGITAKEHHYDDYAGLDVEGKAVLVLRKEPDQGDPHSPFDGTRASRHATFREKISNAYRHGAAAVLLVNDHYGLERAREADAAAWRQTLRELAKAAAAETVRQPPDPLPPEQLRRVGRQAARLSQLSERLQGDYDRLLGFTEAGPRGSHDKTPVFFCLRQAVEEAVRQSLGCGLAELERRIDERDQPASPPLRGWRVEAEADVRVRRVQVKNVIGVLPGAGELADQSIVVGAHYDHLGRGGPGSLARGSREVHNGADDNASGVALMLELARRLAARRDELVPRRRVVFVAFTAEEEGLLGSDWYVRHAPFPLETTLAMLNFDMVGRMDQNRLIVYGTGTAAEFEPLLEEANRPVGLELTARTGGLGRSDQNSFYRRDIPVLHFFTGTHPDYHRPSDDADKINVAGMRRVADLAERLVVRLAQRPGRLTFRRTAERSGPAPGRWPYFGSIPDYAAEAEGYALKGVAPGGPAEQAGLRAGDVLIQLGQSQLAGVEDFASALSQHRAGERVRVVFLRRGQRRETFVTLAPPRR